MGFIVSFIYASYLIVVLFHKKDVRLLYQSKQKK